MKYADRRKDEFLATLAHELRNPLAPLRTGLEVLNFRDADVAADTREMMDRQLSHMVRLIDDLLDVSRMTNDKLTLRNERVLLQTVVEMAIEASRPVIEASRHALPLTLPEEPVWLDADPTRLAQVVSNLLTNAAKYTPESGCIELAAVGGRRSPHPRDRHRTGHPTRDDGQGVRDVHPGEPDARPLAGGLGIGLALVKRLVELHGGTITAESPGLGKGSTFSVRLPLVGRRGASERRRRRQIAPAPSRPPRAGRR